MIDRMRALVRGKTLCVLATVGGGRPHCSLMSYVVEHDCREIFMFTPRDSHKYRNLLANRWVSLLIDSRDEDSLQRIQALTVSGECRFVDDPDRGALVAERFLSVHPHLADLVHGPDTELLAVRITSLQLLDGPTDSYFAEL